MKAFQGRLSRAALIGSLATACLLAVAAGAHAQAAPPFAVLLRESENAPTLALSQAEIRRAEGISEQAGARPNPDVSLATEKVGGSRPYGGFDQAETTLQYNQPIELGGKRSARMAAGRAGVIASQAHDRDARVAFAYDLARAYAMAEVADRKMVLAMDEAETAKSDLGVSQMMRDRGKDPPSRRRQAQSAFNEARVQVELAKAERIGAYARLSALVAADRFFTSLSGSVLDPTPSSPTVGPVEPQSMPSVLAAESDRAAAALRLVADRRNATPDITATVGVRRLSSGNATALVGGISIPLTLFDRNKGNIAAARADVDVADARLAIARNSARAEVSATAAELVGANARLAAATEALAMAENEHHLARLAHAAGKSSE